MAFYDDATYDESTGPLRARFDASALLDDLFDALPVEWLDDEYEYEGECEPVADDFTIQLARELDIDLAAILNMMDVDDSTYEYQDA